MKRRIFLLIFVVSGLVLQPACRERNAAASIDSLRRAYDVEQDGNDPSHVIPLNYQQAQGKRLFNKTCVWCHADVTPAGPSNRSNLNPTPPLIIDGTTLNPLSDAFLKNIITFGGSAMGKSAMMPPWGQTLTPDEIQALIAYVRTVARPPYQAPVRPQPNGQ